jgi:serine/threonine-protein kinase
LASPDTQRNLLTIGAPVGEYRIDGLLGEGAMGTVYRGVHPVIGRQVAIKVLAEPLANHPELCAEFEREARLVNDSTHPNLMNIFGYGMLADGRPYYVMELLEGRSLRELLRDRGRLSPEVALPIFRDVARALGAMHAVGLAHRDLQTDNIFMALPRPGTEGSSIQTKLIDFGLGKPSDRNDPVLLRVRTGKPRGAALYMSPEECAGSPRDQRSKQIA